MMTCNEVATQLDDYVDGVLEPSEALAVETHLAGCAACRAEVDSLRALIAKAGSLPKSIAPPARVWAGIESRIAAPGAARGAGRARARFSMPLFAAAAVVLMLLSSAATALWLQRSAPDRQFTTARAGYEQATADLARQIQENPAGLSPTTIAVLDRNLAIIDAAIREAEEALKGDPGDSSLEEMLLARYQQRLDLLKRATRAGQES